MIHLYWSLMFDKELVHFIHTQILRTNSGLLFISSSLLSGRISTLRDETGAVSIC